MLIIKNEYNNMICLNSLWKYTVEMGLLEN